MLVCSAVFNAGAITSANRIGVTSGTRSSRGRLAVSWKRRRASVASGPNGLRAAARCRRAISGLMADIVGGPPSGSGVLAGESSAGEAQVDVVEGGPAGGDRMRGHPEPVDVCDHIGGGALAQRDGRRMSDREGVVVGE